MSLPPISSLLAGADTMLGEVNSSLPGIAAVPERYVISKIQATPSPGTTHDTRRITHSPPAFSSSVTTSPTTFLLSRSYTSSSSSSSSSFLSPSFFSSSPAERVSPTMKLSSILNTEEETNRNMLNTNRMGMSEFPLSVSPSICARCRKELSFPHEGISLDEGIVHRSCYYCSLCDRPVAGGYLIRNERVLCEKHLSTPPSISNQKNNTIPTGNISCTLQPEIAKYQIANYNIHPPLVLTLKEPVEQNTTITACLIDKKTNTVVSSAFQNSPMRLLRAGQSSVCFAGLKLNKMTPIKDELRSRHLSSEFYITFFIAPNIPCVHTQTFTLLSSCNQLPRDVKLAVRPMKKLNGKNVYVPTSVLEQDIQIALSRAWERSSPPSSPLLPPSSSSSGTSSRSSSGQLPAYSPIRSLLFEANTALEEELQKEQKKISQ